MNEDFVRTARAKGLSERQVLLKHVLRNSLIPIVTLWGLDFAVVIGGGAILTETVFNLQGVGQYAADAIGQLDQPPILAVTMFGAFFVVFFNAIVDIVYALLDPRIRLEAGRDHRGVSAGPRARCSRSTTCGSDFRTEDGHGPGRRRRLVRRHARRGARGRRRVGLRQVGHRDDPDGPHPGPERRRSRAPRSSARPS